MVLKLLFKLFDIDPFDLGGVDAFARSGNIWLIRTFQFQLLMKKNITNQSGFLKEPVMLRKMFIDPLMTA